MDAGKAFAIGTPMFLILTYMAISRGEYNQAWLPIIASMMGIWSIFIWRDEYKRKKIAKQQWAEIKQLIDWVN